MTDVATGLGDVDHRSCARIRRQGRSPHPAWIKGYSSSVRKRIGVRHTTYVDPIGQKPPETQIMLNRAESARRQEADRVDDRDRDDVFLGAKIKAAHACYDLVGQYGGVH